MAKKKVSLFIDPDLISNLKKLSDYTRVPMAEYVREGISLVLNRYKKELKKSPKERR
jgi:hypothetical protein